MKEFDVNRTMKALRLKRPVIGVRFIPYRTEYEALTSAQFDKKTSFCFMVRMAAEGNYIKSTADNFSYQGAASSIGVIDKVDLMQTGRIYDACGLYGIWSIAREVIASMKHIPHKIYGIEVGPLAVMEDAHIAIILGNARQIMRVIHGYTWQFGVAKNISLVGNQAMCSDLAAKTFMNNDINISRLCCGARMYSGCDNGKIGVSDTAENIFLYEPDALYNLEGAFEYSNIKWTGVKLSLNNIQLQKPVLHDIFKAKCIYRHRLTSFEAAKQLIDEYIDFYNNELSKLKRA